jgi:hypothetical protein
MPPRLAINCEDRVAFVITFHRASPSALRYPLWLKRPINENEPSALTRFHVVESTAV